jgi:hypothetical protein
MLFGTNSEQPPSTMSEMFSPAIAEIGRKTSFFVDWRGKSR